MRSMCVFHRKYMHSAALVPDRPPATPPDAKIYYRTRLEFNILLVLVRPRPRNKRFYATKIDFSDSDKKSRVDLGLEQPEMTRNSKAEFPIFCENIT